MTPEAFAAIAGGLAMVKSRAVFGAVRLAVHGRVFATVGWPVAGMAAVKLGAAEQAVFVAQSKTIKPEAGARGKNGVTLIGLAGIDEHLAARVLVAAWRHAQSAPYDVAEAV